MANSGYQYREEDTLGRYTARGLLRYKDYDAYYCKACEHVFNVYCPNCGVRSDREHPAGTSVIVKVGATFERYDGLIWTQVSCQKCDYLFKVIVK